MREVRRGAFVDQAFDRRAESLSEVDRRLAQELAFGVLRLRGRLDYLIADQVTGGIQQLKPDVLDVLRLGVYQLVELDRVPAYAAVSEAVESAKQVGGKGAGALTNAVLRRLSSERDIASRFPRREADPARYLSSWGSHPPWLIERWLARWPQDEVERLVAYNNSRPATYLSVIGSREQAVDRLRVAGIEAVAGPGRTSLRLEAGDLRKALELVPATVQDPGAAAVAEFVTLDRGSRVIDLCAAPGGKAVVLAGRGHRVWACDVSRARLARLSENRERLKFRHLHLVLADATAPPLAPVEVVLLDVPCTGTGTLARHPDGRWRLRPADLSTLIGLQRRLLDAAADLVVPGGRLYYATCSLEPEENREQVEWFLDRRADFERAPSPDVQMSLGTSGPAWELNILPQRDGVDGAYAARLERRA
ncbi:MAG: hypothetical protein JSU87_06185 [Gemmatimonadota bacterium]|nr:MAG: hypothetical protein JSU87_06185 [Gemmatimonadota bacterium]